MSNFNNLSKLILGLATVLLLIPHGKLVSQGTIADYERLNRQFQVTANKVFRINLKPNWIYRDTGLWYRIETAPNEFEFVFVNLKAQSRELAFDQAEVARQLSEMTKQQIAAGRLPFDQIKFDSKFQSVYFRWRGKNYRVDRKSGLVQRVKAADVPTERSTGNIPLSGASRVAIDINIKNELESPIRLFWVDPNGRTKSYGVVEPKQTRRMQTYVDHVWIATDAKRQPLSIMTARSSEQTFTINQDSKVDKTFPLRLGRRRSAEVLARSDATSPDGRFVVSIKNHNLYVRNLKTKDEQQVTRDGTANNFYSRATYWSPDSKKLIVIREIPAEEHKVHLIESSPKGRVQPILHTTNYLKPGDRIRQQTPVLFDTASWEQIPIASQLFENSWRLRDWRWAKDSSEFFFRVNQRGHQVMRIVGIHAESGKSRSVIEDVSKTFIDYNYKFNVRYLSRSNEIIWSSERDGWNHLYLYDSLSGKLKNQITQGNWVVRRIDRIDEAKRKIWFQASGIIQNQDPYYLHHCHIDFNGENLVVMTAGDGTHDIKYSPTGKYILDRYSQVDRPPVHEIREVETGKLTAKLESGDDSRLQATGWKRPERFIATARDGRTPIFGVIYRPSNFDPQKKYPIIEYIYAGPHGSFVPKSFSRMNRNQALTELGFIVVQIDGMGTSNRSKAFHDVCWKNLGDSGFPDRIKWIQAAARKYPYMDVTRIGIYGGSAGGQSALRALLAHGDFYKVAVADCGCHDNRMDKIWWNEQWMGWPIGNHYKEQSNVTNAHKLQGKLFLIVGELDRNVDPASTMQVVNALIKADKDFDLLVVPGGGHGVGSSKYGLRRTYDFFVRHLHQVEPRAQ